LIEKFKQEFQTPICLRVLNVIKIWVQYYWYHFEDDSELKEILIQFIQTIINDNMGTSRHIATNIMTVIQNNEKKKSEHTNNEELPTISPRRTLLDYHAKEIADELTINLRELLEKIKPEEIAKEEPKLSTSPAIERYLEYVDEIQRLFNYEIYISFQKDTVSMILIHLITIARHSLEMNNYEVYVCILELIDRSISDPMVRAAFNSASASDRQFYSDNIEFISDRKKLSERIMALPSPCVPLFSLYNNLMTEQLQKTPAEFGVVTDMNTLINIQNKIVVGDIIFALAKQRLHVDLKIQGNVVIRSYIASRRAVAEQTPLFSTNSETSESEQTPHKSRSESYSGGIDFTLSRQFSGKALLAGFKELMLNEQSFRDDFSKIVLDSVKEDTHKIRNEIRHSLAITTQLRTHSSNNSQINNGKNHSGEPYITLTTPISSIKDSKVRNILSRNFPGANIVTWNYYDAEGAIEGNPENITVDFIHNRDSYQLLDVKDKVGVEDIATLLRIGKLFNGIFPQISLGCVMVTSKITPQASIVADACKMRLYIIR